jgi:predicted RNase H-like HicB family nuclease
MLNRLREYFREERTYQILLEEEEDGTFVATSPALPGYVAYATSEAAAIRKLRRAIRRSLEGIADDYDGKGVRNGRVSRHRAHLYLHRPLDTTTKIVVASLAATAVLAALYELRRRRD